ncbi:zinc transport system permease protein [Clostridium tetanomorphum]|uniref:Metal ABC transporter permease n=1 Tax=Clostridium tetanomorphum TaxID=1553 RepID=A0A923J230_CLOTT|nr:metal ABC transporter permease [Clostridium tetanomorphum]KAJ51349.1 high-affinity Zinc uptake system membrane protein znuB [Clostridium tetanomorphum DSM 665]MBC2399851.1 metal ABC transporter permease [Clostridium tetanomorphum]MBP1866016.1 zinc transport system permease protein [Clostridium tetanomorphum]NRS85930.1 zinc transport system permease protein [Clostridium tetanomorphum]NRZ96060.1 zinc transport system permease protein [Clostridium tetanomorphum]
MFTYTFIQNALIAAVFISILCPSVGTFLVLKRYSMMGDALSHASFAGVALGLILDVNPIICAFIFTSLCALLIEYLRNYYKRFSEIILVIVMTLSVGVAITLISTGKTKSNVNSYLFGSILTVSKTDLYVMLILSIISIILIYILFNKLLYVTFDECGAHVVGININLINYIFALLVGATVSLSIRIMGILVISSMIAVPVATALQLNKGFKATFFYSILFGFIDIILGLLISFYIDCAPGGTIAITSVIILLSLLIYKKIK